MVNCLTQNKNMSKQLEPYYNYHKKIKLHNFTFIFFPEKVISSAYLVYANPVFSAKLYNLESNLFETTFAKYGLVQAPWGREFSKEHKRAK